MRQQEERNRSRRGFTLTELLAALTLTVLLMGCVLGTLTLINRAQHTILNEHGIPAPWELQLEEILAWDLENSRTIEVTETGLRLEGFAGRDLSTRVPIHCPARIEYEIVTFEKRSHLIRRETHTELLDLDNSRTELLCGNVHQILVGALRNSGPVAHAADATKSPKMLPRKGPLPQRLSVSLIGGSPPTMIYSRNFQR